MKTLFLEADAVYEAPTTSLPPTCGVSTCVIPDGDHRSPEGICHWRGWCSQAVYDPTTVNDRYASLEVRDPLELVPYCLDRLVRRGWSIQCWTSRPPKQYTSVIEALKRAGVWSFLDGYHMANVEQVKHPVARKLTLLSKMRPPSAIIESDSYDGAVLGWYTRDAVPVHIAPTIWVSLAVLDVDRLCVFLAGDRHAGVKSHTRVLPMSDASPAT